MRSANNYQREESCLNPMDDHEQKASPLARYEHLLPSASSFINSLDQHQFLVNVNILFANVDPKALRLLITRASDSTHPRRQLYYAVLVIQSPEFSLLNPQLNVPQTLIRGPAVPYFPPPLHEIGSGQKAGSSWIKSGAGIVNMDKEIRETKEQAIKLLMKNLESHVHGVLGIQSLEEDAVRTWKYAEPRGEDALDEEKGSDTSHSGPRRKSNWFSS